jgi:phosphate transport system permease protein
MSQARPDVGARGTPGLPRIPAGVHWTRRVANRVAIGACVLATAIVVLPLALLVFRLLETGLRGLSLDFFLHMPKPVGEPGGGMANAIVGTLIVVGIGAAIAVPIGVAAGVYLAEYGRERLASTVRYTADVLAGAPSIVVGVAVFGLLVVPMGRFSALAGGVALAILMLPTVVRATEEVVRLVPASYRQAALALGAPSWIATMRVVLPAARAGVTTAALLAVARASGETAPLLFTALGNRFWSVHVDQPIATMPVMIFDYARAPYSDWNSQAWTGALTLLVLVTVLSAIMRVVTQRIR